jgi:hypothetical protein
MVEKDAVSKDFRKQVLGYGLTRSGKNHSKDLCSQLPLRTRN